jgi:hypothetical protein
MYETCPGRNMRSICGRINMLIRVLNSFFHPRAEEGAPKGIVSDRLRAPGYPENLLAKELFPAIIIIVIMIVIMEKAMVVSGDDYPIGLQALKKGRIRHHTGQGLL